MCVDGGNRCPWPTRGSRRTSSRCKVLVAEFPLRRRHGRPPLSICRKAHTVLICHLCAGGTDIVPTGPQPCACRHGLARSLTRAVLYDCREGACVGLSQIGNRIVMVWSGVSSAHSRVPLLSSFGILPHSPNNGLSEVYVLPPRFQCHCWESAAAQSDRTPSRIEAVVHVSEWMHQPAASVVGLREVLLESRFLCAADAGLS